VDNNYLNLGMNKSRFVHTLSSGRLKKREGVTRRGQQVCSDVEHTLDNHHMVDIDSKIL
jgi:hypothetical protein